MGIVSRIFGREERADNSNNSTNEQIQSDLIKILLSEGAISENIAMGIPTIASSVNTISNIVASVKFRLYSYDSEGRIVEVDDRRNEIVNCATGDLLNGYEMKRAFIRDYLLNGNGYIYVNKNGNKVCSMHYVDCRNISVNMNNEPIFKSAMYLVNTMRYYPTEFVTITRNSKDGVTGCGLLQDNTLVIRLVNNMMNMLNSNVQSGGVKKGFLKSSRKLTKEALDKLREDFHKLYSSNESRVVALNEGLDFVPATENSTELQLNELYAGLSEDVGEILNVPENIKNGSASEEQYRNWFKNCINPLLEEICAALNESLLLESEKNRYMWRADTSEIEKTDLKSTFEAYKVALDGNMLQLDEVREKLGYTPLGFNYIKLGLDTVLYDVENKFVYTPNTNMVQKMNETNINTIETERGTDVGTEE